MNKKALKFISQLSDLLPLQLYNSNYTVKCSGEDALLSGHTEIDGEVIIPEKDYVLNNTLQKDVSHKRRLKRVYAKRGKAGLITYLKPLCIPERFNNVHEFIINYCP